MQKVMLPSPPFCRIRSLGGAFALSTSSIWLVRSAASATAEGEMKSDRRPIVAASVSGPVAGATSIPGNSNATGASRSTQVSPPTTGTSWSSGA